MVGTRETDFPLTDVHKGHSVEKPKLLVVGHARHGKDTLAEYLRDTYGYTIKDSSRRSAEIFLFDLLKSKYGYADIEECYRDRVNHRAEWFREIRRFNTPDKTKLARLIVETSDVYVGMRDADEINACVKDRVFDLVIWVDASNRLPPEPTSSFNIDQSLADVIIDNNGDKAGLYRTIEDVLVPMLSQAGVLR